LENDILFFRSAANVMSYTPPVLQNERFSIDTGRAGPDMVP